MRSRYAFLLPMVLFAAPALRKVPWFRGLLTVRACRLLTILLFALAVPVTAQQPRVNQLPHPTTPWTRLPPAPRPALPTESTRSWWSTLNSSSWTAIGPAPLQGGISFSGRITGIAAHPAGANTIYIAAAGGGVWKTINGGTTWSPLTDGEATLSMGAIAIAPSDPSVIYAGTGEANNSGDSNYGRGILISTDGGTSWTLSAGPSGDSGPIFDRLTTSQIAVDPTNSSVAYAAFSDFGNNALCCGATGIWKTTDGGASWANTTAAAGLSSSLPWTAVAIDPNDNQVLFAALGLYFGAADNGVYKSTDAGASWTLLSNGPTGTPAGRITLALAPSNGRVLYVVAAAATPTAGVYKVMRSDDAGATFTDLTAGTPNFVGSQGWYDLVVAVDPATSSTVYLGGATGGNAVLRSTDSGAHWVPIGIGGSPDFVSPHADHHAFAFDANGHLLDGDDGGIFRLDNPAVPSWSDLNGDLNTIQFYGIGLHPTDTSVAVGGSQDNGTEVFSGSLTWTETDGGDGGFAKISQQNGSLMYHQIPVLSFGANFFRASTDGGHTWHTATSGIVADLNFQDFIAPFAVDPGDGNRVLYGTNRVWETTTAGSSWTPISNIGVGGWSSDGALFVDAIGLALSDTNTIYAVENPFHPQVFVTIDHGATWTEHEIVPLSVFVGDLQVDPIDPNTAYAVINNFSSVGNIFRTTDGGASWTSITGNLPNEPVWSLQIDPTTTPHTLYLGADDGVYVSTNSGVSWSRFGEGLPDAQAFQLELNPSLHLLGVATHGRGMWEILTPTPAVTVTNVTSLTPDGTYGAGATISIQVTFSGTVNVTGTPQLTLNSGGTANYASGSVGSTLTFIYTVAAGERSSHLDYNSTMALSLNSGTINDTAGNAANLTLPASGAPGSLGANSNIVIGSSSCLQTGVARLMGRVRTAGEREMPGIPDVTVTLTGPGNCQDTTTTNAMGHYVFRALGGGTYTVTPEKDGCSFIPRSRTISVAEADPRANFRGMCRDNR